MNEFDKPIIVPWDFSEIAEYALQHAVNYSAFLGKDIALVHIIKKKSEMEPATEKLIAKTEEIKKKYGIKPHFIIREGSIFTTITEVSEEVDATMAIMGTHGMKGMQKITGSWALKVITGSKCPFVVVQAPPTEKEVKKIVFPVDFKSEEKEKLIWANFLYQLFKSKFYLGYVESSDLGFRKKVQANITVAQKYLNDKGIDYEVIKFEGKGSLPTDAINYAKEVNAGMILVTTTKNISFQDYVLGANEQQIIANEAKIPVMCINPRQDLKRLGAFA